MAQHWLATMLPVGKMVRDMTGKARFSWSLIANTFAAFFGTAIIESPLSHRFRVHSIAELLARSFGLSVLCGCLLGYFVFRLRRSPGALWVWTAGVCWMLIGCVAALFSEQSDSVLQVHHTSLWETISGAACRDPSLIHCMQWMVFPLFALRVFAYSAGAAVCARFGHTGSHWMMSEFTGRLKQPEYEKLERE